MKLTQLLKFAVIGLGGVSLVLCLVSWKPERDLKVETKPSATLAPEKASNNEEVIERKIRFLTKISNRRNNPYEITDEIYGSSPSQEKDDAIYTALMSGDFYTRRAGGQLRECLSVNVKKVDK